MQMVLSVHNHSPEVSDIFNPLNLTMELNTSITQVHCSTMSEICNGSYVL